MRGRESQRVSERIQALFDAASELLPEARAEFLDSNLNPLDESDTAIRQELERLLFHHDCSGILDKTLIQTHTVPDAPAPALDPGELVSKRFRIVRMIGSGGMGEVYEAEDLTVGQTVALKTIRADMAGDISQAERFRRELRISRNLAHRNVCKVFEYGDIDRGPRGHLRFFTMELLRGETLAQRLTKLGRLSPNSALEILRQVASGLDEVHRGGIIHRDLKPSNIFLVRGLEGRERAVVMDFGIARNLSDDELRQTVTGMAMGTRLYMAPELPHVASVFSDVYAFGVIALEMVTGAASPLVPPRSIIPSLDPVWDKALLACFDLDPAKRPASALEVVAILSRRTRPWRKAAVASGIAAACVAAGVAVWHQIDPAPTPVSRTTQITFDSGLSFDPSSSADGKLLAYASDRNSSGDLNIWLQNLETGETRQITSNPDDEDAPALSPDGKLIAWHSHREDALYMKPVAGGTPRELAKHTSVGRFSPDGRYIAWWEGVEDEANVPASAWVVPTAGGAPRNLAPGFADARLPAWSTDGKSILFRGSRTASPSIEQAQDWWITSLDGRSIRPTGAGRRLRAAGLATHESPVLWDGSKVIFAAMAGESINLWSIGLLPVLGLAFGAPQQVTFGAGFQDVPAFIAGGRIAYADWHEQIHVFRIGLSTGDLTQITNQDSRDTRVSASAGGDILVFDRRGTDKIPTIWEKDLRTPERSEHQLPEKHERSVNGELAAPFISPDGRTAAVSSGSSIRLIDIATEGQSVVCTDCGELRGWMPGAQQLLYLDNRSDSPAIRLLDPVTKSKRTLLSAPGLNEAAVSPDGKTLAFTVRAGGINSAIFIARLTPGGVTSHWTQVTPEAGWADKPVWSHDAETLYFSSRQDGFLCIWKRSVDPVRLRLRGEPQPVRHFHTATQTLYGLSPSTFGLALGGDSLFLSVDVSQSNIWAIKR